jgi:hypothetical protein
MSGRRSHTRFTVASPWGGVLRVLRDAVVNRNEAKELLAVTHAAAVTGEELTLDLMSDGQTVAIKVRVLESRPVMVDGAVRHRVRLALPTAAAEQVVIDGQIPDASQTEQVTSDALENITLRVAEAG